MNILTSLDPSGFMRLVPEREAMIAKGGTEPLPDKYGINALAEALHPVRQYLKVSSIEKLTSDTVAVKLVPDADEGTAECAYFQPGDYLSFFLKPDGKETTRPYSIASSPKDSLKGFYTVIVKRVPGGKASNYIADNWKRGTKVVSSGPISGLVYSPLRDAKTVIGLVGGSAITSFMSMAKAISEGDADFDLILLYGSKTHSQIIAKGELDALAAQCKKIKVIYVLSEEQAPGCEHGFISAEMIKKYAPKAQAYSLFVSGPPAMISFVRKEISKLGVEQKYVRYEIDGEVHDALTMSGYPGNAPDKVKITVKVRDMTKTVTGSTRETVLQILEENGVAVPAHCRSGVCGYCHTRLVSGKVFVPKVPDMRREADREFGYIHPCRTFPLSDLEIIVPSVK